MKKCELCHMSKWGPRHLLMRLCDRIASWALWVAWYLDTEWKREDRDD